MIQEQMSSEYEEADDIEEDQEFLPGSCGKEVGRELMVLSQKLIQEMAAASKLRMAAFNYCDSRYSIAKCIK